MEPFWNYIRVHQVLGRAVRLKSHVELPKDERNVEQYLYLSILPEGDSIESVFTSLKELEWNEVNHIQETDDIKQHLVSNHKDIYKMITKMKSIQK